MSRSDLMQTQPNLWSWVISHASVLIWGPLILFLLTYGGHGQGNSHGHAHEEGGQHDLGEEALGVPLGAVEALDNEAVELAQLQPPALQLEAALALQHRFRGCLLIWTSRNTDTQQSVSAPSTLTQQSLFYWAACWRSCVMSLNSELIRNPRHTDN